MSNLTRCAACKSLRRRCAQDCILAPYFPPNNPERFACVHKIFGASNVTKMLEQLPVHSRADAADCMTIEASTRIQHPVYGCTQTIFQLQQQIIQTQYEIATVQGQIAVCRAQQQMNNHHHHHHHQHLNLQNQNQYQQQPSWMMNAIHDQQEEEQVHLDHQQQLAEFHHPPQF